MDAIHGYEIVEEINKGGFCDAYKVKKGGNTYFLKQYKDPTPMCDYYRAFMENQTTMIPLLKALGGLTETIIEDFEDNGRYHQVKEFIPGSTNLRDWMETNENYDERLDAAIQFCEILKAVHEKKIIHQDLKPEQVMTVKDPSKKAGIRLILTDFDWSVPNGREVKRVNTPGYGNIDATLSYKSDIFTTGIILCELLTGCNPYNMPELGERIFEPTLWVEWVKKRDYLSPVKINTDLPKYLNDIITKCLEPNAEDRPTIDAIIDALKGKVSRMKAKLRSASGDMMIMVPGMAYGRKHFKELFGRTTDEDANEIYKYLDKTYAILDVVQEGDKLLISCPAYGMAKNKILLRGEELTDVPTQARDGDTLSIFSTSKDKEICSLSLEIKQ
ncbi:MAG: protein kinase [Bacteroidales bacterium]|nr:protein kinase [Bacteroidales bacterium]